MIGLCGSCKKNFRKREQKYKFCSLSCSSKFNSSHRSKNFKMPHHNKKLAEFIGICLGDGYVSSYQVGITLNSVADKEYIPYVVNLIKSLFPKVTISLSTKKTENIVLIRINSKSIALFIKKMGIVPNAKYIPAWIYKRPTYIKHCIRGLFDTEGSISFKVYAGQVKIGLYKQLNFRNTNILLMIFVRDGLLSFGFKPTRTLKKSLYLSNHESIAQFGKVIGFSNPKLQERSEILTIEDYRKWKEQEVKF